MSNFGNILTKFDIFFKCKIFISFMKYFSFSGQGLNRININSYIKDFEICFRNNIHLQIPRFIAEFISPEISNLLKNDSTSKQFYIDDNVSQETLQQLEQLTLGKPIDITLKDPISKVLIHLRNPEIINLMDEELTFENFAHILDIKTLLSIDVQKEIDFAASHFEDIKKCKTFPFHNGNLS